MKSRFTIVVICSEKLYFSCFYPLNEPEMARKKPETTCKWANGDEMSRELIGLMFYFISMCRKGFNWLILASISEK